MSELKLLVEAILFDMDGTLVDSTKVVERTWHRFAERHQLDTATILDFAHGRPTSTTVSEFAVKGVDIVAETARIQEEEERDVAGVIEVPGSVKLLDCLPRDRWAVVTSAGTHLAQRRMGAAGLPLPKVLLSADDVGNGKPDPEGYLRAAERLGVDPSSTIVLEDAEAGLVAARASGATVVVVGDYAGPAAEGLSRISDLQSVRVREITGRAGLEFTIAQ